MLNFDPDAWLAENGGDVASRKNSNLTDAKAKAAKPAKPTPTLAGLAGLALARAETEKSQQPVSSQPTPRRQPARIDLSGFDVTDDDDGWIGESPRQTRHRLLQSGWGEAA